MNNDNKALFIFSLVFFFIGDLATTYIALNNGLPEKGFIRVMGSPGIADMIITKLVFFIALYFLIVFFEKRDNYLCSAVLGLYLSSLSPIYDLIIKGSARPKIICMSMTQYQPVYLGESCNQRLNG